MSSDAEGTHGIGPDAVDRTYKYLARITRPCGRATSGLTRGASLASERATLQTPARISLARGVKRKRKKSKRVATRNAESIPSYCEPLYSVILGAGRPDINIGFPSVHPRERQSNEHGTSRQHKKGTSPGRVGHAYLLLHFQRTPPSLTTPLPSPLFYRQGSTRHRLVRPITGLCLALSAVAPTF